MRRIRIILYWLFSKKNNITFSALLKFCLKPPVRTIANRYLDSIVEKDNFYAVSFKPMNDILYWPKAFSIDGIYQVTAETFDKEDWHYYQNGHTPVEPGELLLDIGAAEGLFALSVINTCKKIFLIEPNDYFVESMQKTFQNHKAKIQIFNVAIGSQEGEISFDQNSLSGKISEENTVSKKRLTKVDTILKEEKITYLKADVEGFELEVLKGAESTIKRNKPKIAITTYHPENDPQAIIELIRKYVPEYKYHVKGIIHTAPKPVMIHFWI